MQCRRHKRKSVIPACISKRDQQLCTRPKAAGETFKRTSRSLYRSGRTWLQPLREYLFLLSHDR
ncbi:hypothetical protein GWR21_02230 [Chitinophaga agri]|uniref:Uncharacterized protein n=1 Tax=Chitinophaga agri TaxID=2703787 RepID=A0A6B9ZPL1_9BACT|nr:hypothetical protein GWR21_02230 [Chitinophaga agri]